VQESTVAEGPARLVQQPPRLRAYCPVDADPALLLEVSDGLVDRGVERALVRSICGEEAQADQPTPDLADGRTAVAAAIDLLHASSVLSNGGGPGGQ
jgi:hypothetical protein